jgi:hypothetical protein
MSPPGVMAHRWDQEDISMTRSPRFLVLCPECPLDEVHRNAGPARRTAEQHHHHGAAVIRLSAIRGTAHHNDDWDLGLILTSADARFPAKKIPPPRRFSRLNRLLVRFA